jgi:hypothetical protein
MLVRAPVGTGRGEAGSGVRQPGTVRAMTGCRARRPWSLCLRRIGCRSVQRVWGEHPEVLLADSLSRLMESAEQMDVGRLAAQLGWQ